MRSIYGYPGRTKTTNVFTTTQGYLAVSLVFRLHLELSKSRYFIPCHALLRTSYNGLRKGLPAAPRSLLRASFQIFLCHPYVLVIRLPFRSQVYTMSEPSSYGAASAKPMKTRVSESVATDQAVVTVVPSQPAHSTEHEKLSEDGDNSSPDSRAAQDISSEESVHQETHIQCRVARAATIASKA
jgi:hypothetical protein